MRPRRTQYVPPGEMSHVVEEGNPSTALREQCHDEIGSNRGTKEMQEIPLKTDVGLSHTYCEGESMFNLVSFSRRQLAVEQTEGIAGQKAEDKSELLRSESSSHSKRV